MNIVYCINDNPTYINMMYESMRSFDMHHSNIKFYVIVNTEKKLNIRLEEYYRITQIPCKLTKTYRERLNSHEGPTDRLNNTSYLKLWIPELLKDKVNRCLFVDCDILCFGNIEDEYNSKIASRLALSPINIQAQRKIELGIKETDNYYSTGLMLFDFTKDYTNWRENLFSNIQDIPCSFWCHEETLINYNEKSLEPLPYTLCGYNFSITPWEYAPYANAKIKLIHFGGKSKLNFYNAANFLRAINTLP